MLRYRLRTLLMVMVAAAIFFGGYRLGWQHGRDSRFDDVIQLISTTIVGHSGWDESCREIPDGQPEPSSNPVDPFASPESPLAADDPFAAPKSAPYSDASR